MRLRAPCADSETRRTAKDLRSSFLFLAFGSGIKTHCLWCPLSLTPQQLDLQVSRKQSVSCVNKVLIELWTKAQISPAASK